MTTRNEVFQDLLAKRDADAEEELEGQLSVNDWIQRIQGSAQTARMAARAGTVELEVEAWQEIACAVIGRLEYLQTRR